MQPGDESAPDAISEEQELPSPAEEAFQRAMQHEQNNELDKAIEDCTEAIRLDPDNLDYLVTRAELYGETRNFNKALDDAGKVLEKDKTNLRARATRGKMFELSGDVDKALAEFNAAVETNPNSWQALFERQTYFQRQGQYDRAMSDSDRMTQLEPTSAAGYLSRALTHGISGEFDHASDYASAVIQQNPESWLAYNIRGGSRAVNGDFTGAFSDFETAFKLSPDNPFVYSARAAAYHMRGEYEKSISDLTRAVELSPDGYGFKAQLADLLATCPDENIRNGQRASQIAGDALRLAPNDPLVLRAAAAAAAENGDFEAARKWQERVLSSNGLTAGQQRQNRRRLAVYDSGKPYVEKLPSVDDVLANKKIKQADDAIENGNFDRAIALLSEVIAADSKNARAYRERGFAFFKHEEYDPAITNLNQAIEINSKDSDSYYYRGRTFEKMRQYDKARADFLKTYALEPTATEMDNILAWFFATCPDEKVRDGTKAANYIDRAIKLRPNSPPVWDTRAAVFAENGDFDNAVKWEQAYIDRTDITEDQRRDGGKRLALYQKHQPYHKEPEEQANVTASTTPAQPGK